MLSFFKRKEKKQSFSDTLTMKQNIYCSLFWNSRIGNAIKLIGYNKALDLEILCSQNVFIRQNYHSTTPSANIYIPRILYEIDWNFVFNNGIDLKEFKITFFNYTNSTREYSVLLECVNSKNKQVVDTFTSTIKVFIDPYELTDNIKKFLKYAETAK